MATLISWVLGRPSAETRTAEARWSARTPCPVCGARCLKAQPAGTLAKAEVRCNWCKWKVKGAEVVCSQSISAL